MVAMQRISQNLAVAEHGGQWQLEFVGDDGHHLVLDPLQFFQFGDVLQYGQYAFKAGISGRQGMQHELKIAGTSGFILYAGGALTFDQVVRYRP